MATQSLKSKVTKGAVWTLMEKLSTQVVGFVVGMILARLLTPEAYGTVALTGIFFAVAGVLVDGGFGNALVQKKDADDLDFNSVFYLNIFMSLLAYAVLFLAGPWIARFYKTPELTMIVRVSAICFLFHAVNAIQGAELAKKMLFHLSFRISLITCFTSAICGVALAFLGYGVWALVWSSLITGFVGMIARWFVIAWRPKLMFSLTRLRPLFSYGWKMATSGLLDAIFRNINSLLIGKFYTKSDIAFVRKGFSLPALAMKEVDETIGRVSFPALVLLQDDTEKLRNVMRRMIQCSTFLVFPLMVGIAACSYSILRLLYGSQWTFATPYMKLACFTLALWPFHTINLKGIMALGRSDVFLKLEVIKKTLALVVLLSTFRLGVLRWMVISSIVLGPLSVVINSWPNRKLLGYTIGMQLRDVMPTVLVCIFEAAVVLGIDFACDACAPMFGVGDAGVWFNVFLASKLMLQFVFGAGIFFGLSYAFRLKPMGEYLRMTASAIGGKFPRIARLLERRFAV
jgi:O-antigen/teichoic acid export membrane protein